MEMEKINTIEEVQNIALDIAKVFDDICTRNNIPYYMLGGTMLGAIRHKGFIPWDDDMDFGVPRPYYDRLLSLLEAELPSLYRAYSSRDKGYVYNFIKITNVKTFGVERGLESRRFVKLGVFIDIFPLDYCTENDNMIQRVWNVRYKMLHVYALFRSSYRIITWYRKLRRIIWPIPISWYLRKADSYIENKKTPFLGNVYGRWREKEIIPVDWYGNGVRYEFEDYAFIGIKDYDLYLEKLYGDYMQLPSIEHRKPHIENIYRIQ